MTRNSAAIATAWVLTLGLVTSGCGGSQPATDDASTAAPPTPPTVAARVAFYQECWGLFNDKAWDRFAQCYSATAESDQVDSGLPVASGTEAVLKSAQDFVLAFPDMKGSLQLVLANDRHIAALSLLNGTHTGPLMGGPDPVPATNKPIGLLMGHVVEGDALSTQIVRDWSYNENATLMAQLGLSKAPARPVMSAGAASPTVVVAGGSATEAANLAAWHAQMEQFNEHDAKGVASHNAETAVFHVLADPKDGGAKENDAMIAAFFQGFPDARLSSESSWAAGDYVVARGAFEGTNTGAMRAMGIAKPTGKSVRVHFLEISRYENGKLAEDWLVYDGMAFAAQLGLLGQ